MAKRGPDIVNWSCGPDWINADHEAVYAQVVQDPEDDAPRLILTDIFEEEGQDRGRPYLEALAKFIRLQIKMAAKVRDLPYFIDSADSMAWDSTMQAAQLEIIHMRKELHNLYRQTEYVSKSHPIYQHFSQFARKQNPGQWIQRGFVEALPIWSGSYFRLIKGGLFNRYPLTRVIMPDRAPRSVHLPETWEEVPGSASGELRRVEPRTAWIWVRGADGIQTFSSAHTHHLPSGIYEVFSSWPGRHHDSRVRETVTEFPGGLRTYRFEFANAESAKQVLGWALAEYGRIHSGLGPGTPWHPFQGSHRGVEPKPEKGDFDFPPGGRFDTTVQPGNGWTSETDDLFPEVRDGRIFSYRPLGAMGEEQVPVLPSDYEGFLEPRDEYQAVITTEVTGIDRDHVGLYVNLRAVDGRRLGEDEFRSREFISFEDLVGRPQDVESVRRRAVQRLQRQADNAFRLATGRQDPREVGASAWGYSGPWEE